MVLQNVEFEPDMSRPFELSFDILAGLYRPELECSEQLDIGTSIDSRYV